MARTILKDKSVLVLGADSAIGRAIALQFARSQSRVIAAGEDEAAVTQVCDLIVRKGGQAVELPIEGENEMVAAVLRTARDVVGHIHFVINPLAIVEGTAKALAYHRALAPMLNERSFTRYAVLWPEGAEWPRDPSEWLTLVRAGSIGSSGEDEGTTLKPGAVADCLVSLLQCPPSACPVEVALKAIPPRVGASDSE